MDNELAERANGNAPEMDAPPFPVTVEPTMTAARRMAFRAWNELRRPDDPTAESLPEGTQMKLEMFANCVRNYTIDQMAGAMKKFFDASIATAHETMLGLKQEIR